MFAPNDNNKFLAIVRLKLLANTHLSITEVNDLAFVKETYFDEGDYSTLRSLLLENNIEKVKRWSPLQLRSKEFLNVLKFRNQDNKEFIVTIYDAPSLRQDPEIIEVFPL